MKHNPCCTPLDTTASDAFHLSLNVADLDRSVEFFSTFLGLSPAKEYTDYAKFELKSPPLVLSLQPGSPRGGGALNHLGFRVGDSTLLVEMQRRLEKAGISTRREEGVACCYARQTKFWVEDPDKNLWEVYVVEVNLEHRDEADLQESHILPMAPQPESQGAIWEHRLGQKFPIPLMIRDRTVDRIALDGTLNDGVSRQELHDRLTEVRRVLRPRGVVEIHVLVADRPVPEGPLNLPGPASAVECVPLGRDVKKLLVEAGFQQIRRSFWDPEAWFQVGESNLHEARYRASAPE